MPPDVRKGLPFRKLSKTLGLRPDCDMKSMQCQSSGAAPKDVGASRKGIAFPHISGKAAAPLAAVTAFCLLLTAPLSSCSLPTAHCPLLRLLDQATHRLPRLAACSFLLGSESRLGGRQSRDSARDHRRRQDLASQSHNRRKTPSATSISLTNKTAGSFASATSTILQSNDEPRAYLMKTSDGGEHWKRVNMRGADVDARLMRAIFSRSGRGWAFGEGGAIYTTQRLRRELDQAAGADALSSSWRRFHRRKQRLAGRRRLRRSCKHRTAAKPGITSQRLPVQSNSNGRSCTPVQLCAIRSGSMSFNSIAAWVGQ